uniref:Uncharacterized protein n=1 Tax=Anopheles minimus TaxID=112268 RepID=A0A182WNP2_9DIPT
MQFHQTRLVATRVADSCYFQNC